MAGNFLAPAASAVGKPSEIAFVIETTDADAFYLISVRQVGPRKPDTTAHSINWTQRNTLIMPPPGKPIVQNNMLVLQNPNTFEVTVACRVFRLDQV
jgi:hypothetical protein